MRRKKHEWQDTKYVLSYFGKLTRGNVSKAAKLAGKYRSDFYDLLKKHDLNPSDFKRTKQGV